MPGGYAGCQGGVCYVQPVGTHMAMTEAPATLVVSLPADAVLTIDGTPTTSTSAERVFRTPSLEPGQDFEYTLEAKVVRGGEPKVIKQRVTVRAGQETTVRLEVPATTGAAE
jgi:uncharacterized protein (TIGR03000 family)